MPQWVSLWSPEMTQGFLENWGPVLDFCIPPCLLPSVRCIYGGPWRFIDSWMGAEFYKGNGSHRENSLQIVKAGMGGVAKGEGGKDLTWKTEYKKLSCLRHTASVLLPMPSCLLSSCFHHLGSASGQCFLASDTSPLSCRSHYLNRLYHAVPTV